MARVDGTLTSVLGVTRSGKTAWTRKEVQGAGRVLVWDVKPDPNGGAWGEWGAFPEFRPVTSWAALGALLRRPPDAEYCGAPGRYAFHPADASRAQFLIFAGAALRWAMAADAVIIAEELPDVTGAGKAESAWGRLTRQGLGLGATIYALSQRPAESDKTTLGNSTRVHVGRLGLARDFAYAAELLRLDDAAPVKALRPLEFLERRPDDSVIAGKIAFRSKGLAYTVGRPRVVKKAP